MKRGLVAAILTVGAAVCAHAQSAALKIGLSSAVVYGATWDGKQLNFVSRAGGFFIDSRHVVSNVLDCCGKTDKGEQLIPVVSWSKDDSGAAKVIWSSQDTEIAILELEKPMNHPGVPIAPSKLVPQGEDVYAVQYPKPGESGAAQVATGKLTGSAAVGDKNIPLYKSNLQMNPGNSGGAMFDSCGNVIGINLAMKDGAQYAFVIDPLIDALMAAGVQATIANQPCSGAGGGGSSGAQGGSKGGEGDGGKHGQGKEKDGKGKDGGAEAPGSGLRWPMGAEWIPVGIVLGLLGLAFRPARKQVVQAITGRHRIPQPATYPGAAPAYPQASGPLAGGTMPYPSGTALPYPPGTSTPMGMGHPVLKGITGQYAGSAFTLDAYGNTLGRDPAAANLVFSGDAASVSKRHCTVRWDAQRGVFLLEDHGSTNGTFLVSGERLAPHHPRELRPGDRFYIGDLRNQFEVAIES